MKLNLLFLESRCKQILYLSHLILSPLIVGSKVFVDVHVED